MNNKVSFSQEIDQIKTTNLKTTKIPNLTIFNKFQKKKNNYPKRRTRSKLIQTRSRTKPVQKNNVIEKLSLLFQEQQDFYSVLRNCSEQSDQLFESSQKIKLASSERKLKFLHLYGIESDETKKLRTSRSNSVSKKEKKKKQYQKKKKKKKNKIKLKNFEDYNTNGNQLALATDVNKQNNSTKPKKHETKQAINQKKKCQPNNPFPYNNNQNKSNNQESVAQEKFQVLDNLKIPKNIALQSQLNLGGHQLIYTPLSNDLNSTKIKKIVNSTDLNGPQTVKMEIDCIHGYVWKKGVTNKKNEFRVKKKTRKKSKSKSKNQTFISQQLKNNSIIKNKEQIQKFHNYRLKNYETLKKNPFRKATLPIMHQPHNLPSLQIIPSSLQRRNSLDIVFTKKNMKLNDPNNPNSIPMSPNGLQTPHGKRKRFNNRSQHTTSKKKIDKKQIIWVDDSDSDSDWIEKKYRPENVWDLIEPYFQKFEKSDLKLIDTMCIDLSHHLVPIDFFNNDQINQIKLNRSPPKKQKSNIINEKNENKEIKMQQNEIITNTQTNLINEKTKDNPTNFPFERKEIKQENIKIIDEEQKFEEKKSIKNNSKTPIIEPKKINENINLKDNILEEKRKNKEDDEIKKQQNSCENNNIIKKKLRVGNDQEIVQKSTEKEKKYIGKDKENDKDKNLKEKNTQIIEEEGNSEEEVIEENGNNENQNIMQIEKEPQQGENINKEKKKGNENQNGEKRDNNRLKAIERKETSNTNQQKSLKWNNLLLMNIEGNDQISKKLRSLIQELKYMTKKTENVKLGLKERIYQIIKEEKENKKKIKKYKKVTQKYENELRSIQRKRKRKRFRKF
ncbi:hypothetical protein M0812_13771 [Anaeramoeba flamelloides]|uniref:Uncharacterized protein n=1 Tax=Anaeramoeba flamelloides TaxID=1746091 RepID=A0AAV7ZM55_9EUKA|nr:hypothetical protein M0812_13771 [Anaeramoeba flamelloides]